LEKIAEGKGKVAYKDFAHSPSKVAATTKAVKEQYPNRTLVACLELHTYSSLNAEFLKEYEGALEYADVAVVFYFPDAVKIKQLEEVTYEQIAKAFNREDLIIYTNPGEFKEYLFNLNLENSALLLMSSGNYGGLNFDEVVGDKKLVANETGTCVFVGYTGRRVKKVGIDADGYGKRRAFLSRFFFMDAIIGGTVLSDVQYNNLTFDIKFKISQLKFL